MKRVAIIFDNHGNPGQPYLAEWFNRIKISENLLIKGFTDRNHTRARSSLCELRPRGLAAFLRRQKARLLRVSGTPADGMPLLLPLLSFKPDVVHVLNGQQYELYRRAVASVNAKLVVSFRGYETTVRPYEDSDWVHKLRQIYEHADGLHFVSEYLKGEGLRLGAPMEKCVVIRRSVDLDFFSPIDRDQRNGLNILSVGRFTWQKGFTTLLESIALLQGRGILAALTLVGAGAEESLLKAKVLELGLQNVIFTGHLDRSQLLEQYHKADIFVQPSVSEALPNSLLEASACGLPLVVTRVGGIPEAVSEGQSAFVVEPSNAGILASAIEKLIMDQSMRRTMGLMARRMVEENFDARKEKIRWHEYYATLCKQ